jgi:hypothetical protein
MRKIEKAMCLAIGQKKSWQESNTAVVYQPEISTDEQASPDYAQVYLHGNHLGTFIYSLSCFHVNMATLTQWPTATTKSRLRALGASV